VRHAVIALAEKIGASVDTTFKGKGLTPDDHPNAVGVLGRSGTPIAGWFMNQSDLIVILGSSFANHTGIDASKPIIQVDFEQMQLGKLHPVALPIWGEIGQFCELACAHMPRRPNAIDQTAEIAEIAERWQIWRVEKASRILDDLGGGINAATVFAVLTQRCPENAIISVDVGNNAYSFGRYFRAYPVNTHTH
jgi:pyruvate oxidase